MLRQRTTRSTRPPVPLTASSNDSAMPPDDHTPLLQPPSPSRASKGPPSLPTTISSLDAAFEPTLPISPSSGSSTLSDSHTREAPDASMDLSSLSRKSQWITLAVASGACAAFNGVFAKLTTTDLTTSIATSVANLLGLGSGEKAVEVVIRAMFFILNLVFNGIMWTLFTKALARGTSTTQVSIINTSANFMITAVLGFFIFSESLPPLWWLGAALLVAGNVIIGRREEADSSSSASDTHAATAAENGEYVAVDTEDVDDLLGDSLELTGSAELDSDTLKELRRKEAAEEEDILDLGDEDTPHPSQQAPGSSH